MTNTLFFCPGAMVTSVEELVEADTHFSEEQQHWQHPASNTAEILYLWRVASLGVDAEIDQSSAGAVRRRIILQMFLLHMLS